MLTIHYFTTDKSNIYVIIAVSGYALMFLAGAMLRIKKIKSLYFKKKIVMMKVAVLAVVVVMTLVGHNIFEKKEHKGKEHHSEEHSYLTIK